MYLSKKNRPTDFADHTLLKLYQQEHRTTLSKVGTITHDVEQVAKMVKAFWNSTADDKRLALEKLIGVLDALNTLRYEQRDLLRRPYDSKRPHQCYRRG